MAASEAIDHTYSATSARTNKQTYTHALGIMYMRVCVMQIYVTIITYNQTQFARHWLHVLW